MLKEGVSIEIIGAISLEYNKKLTNTEKSIDMLDLFYEARKIEDANEVIAYMKKVENKV